MKIVNNTPVEPVKLFVSDVKIGDCFDWFGQIWLKLNSGCIFLSRTDVSVISVVPFTSFVGKHCILLDAELHISVRR